MNKTARKCLSGLLAVCMLIGVMPVSLAASDIDGHWAQTALEHFIQQDWLKGYDGAYTPNATMTRAEYAALINRVGGLTAVSDKIGDYTDVPEGAWYHDDMAKALAAGYMNGVSASSMAPAGELTREQAFTMLARLLSCTAEETALDSFPDKADVADYAREAVAGLVKAGYVSGTGEGTLAPKAVITRAEGVTILYNALQAIQDLGKAEKGPYTDGVYTGTGAGYGGTVKVQMTVENGNITKIEVLSHKETYAYYNRASRLIDTVLEKQTTDGVDAVSGATGSSKGLLTAMGACVSQAKGGKDTSRTGRTGSSSGSSAGDKPEGDDYTESTLKDGVYEGKALGNGGNITVKVTVENGKIAKIEASYPFEDEEYFGSSDADLLTKRIIDNQSTKVDGISGATHSSDGLKTAVENALKGAESADQPQQPGAEGYVLMNIPYAEFYAAEGDKDVDAVTSSTLNKPRTGTLAGGSYHVNSDGTDISGVVYPVYVKDDSVLKGLTEITDESKVTITVTNRGQTSETTYEGRDALFEAPHHAYYKLAEKPSYFKTLTVENGAFTFSAVTGESRKVEGVTGEVGYGGHHTDVEIKLTGTEGIESATVVSGVVLTLSNGSAEGLRHVYNIWRGTELGWNYDELALGGKTITNIRYITKDAVIDYPVEIAVKPVYEGQLTAETDGKTLTFAALPDDLGETTLTVTYTVGSGRAAKRVNVFEGALAETVTLSEPVFDEPVEGEGVYSATVVSSKYADIAVKVNQTADDTDEKTFVLMNIPYAEFYAAEGDDDVDAVTSSTLNKPRTGTLAGGSYHVNSDGTDISGVIYPVLVQDAAALEGLTEITDSSSVTISVTNRGQTSETTYEGKDALFEANDHAYYKLAEEPALYKTLTVEGDKFTFSAVTGEAKKVEGVTADVTVGGHHTDVEIKLTGAEGVDNTTVVSGVVLTDSEGAKYGLRHVYNIWRGTELGWNLGEYDLGGKTITNIRYITKDAVIDFPVEFTVGEAA
ncbi:MAG: FMN-binding protein, partial [Ruminococcaceae bacterium]|nr:FMN-binding protein [Oscillospiraceae bacterium]